MESGYSVSDFELRHFSTDFVYNTGNVVALIRGRLVGHPFWTFPIS